jgi:hypothetical protein
MTHSSYSAQSSPSKDRQPNSVWTLLVPSPCVAALLALTVALIGWAAAAGASSPAGSSAPAATPALSLSNEHVGMTADEVEASQSGTVVESTPAEVGASNDLQAQVDVLMAAAEQANQRALEASAHAEAARLAVVAAERSEAARLAAAAVAAASVPAVAVSQQDAASYESCFEAAIRRGVTYAESNRMCRSSSARAE